MPLLSLWKSNPDAVAQLSIEQIVTTAGDGNLRDNSDCSDEIRTYFSEVPTSKIAQYIDQCLASSFKPNGMVLQDLVNEVGRRLEYEVINGRYQGVANAVGYDGIWRAPDGNDLVVEVKTTDAYRISLDTIAGYRRRVTDMGDLGISSSILIVVGRQDTGELEAQIRGSRHAWDVRLISAEALLKLLQVKENSNDLETGSKVRSIFSPVEYTRLDRMVDVVFTAATESEMASDLEVVNLESGIEEQKRGAPVGKTIYQFTDAALLKIKRGEIIEALGARESTHLLQKSRAQFWNTTRDVRVICSLSKRYSGKNQNPYWYAYHPQWDDFLKDSKSAFFVLGCMDRVDAFAIPRSELLPILPKLHQTVREGGAYWHIHLAEQSDGLAIVVPGSPSGFSLQPFRFMLKNEGVATG